MNVLFAGNVFTSLFFDWENSDASVIAQLGHRFSDQSIYYAQNATYDSNTSGKYHPLHETIYLTLSLELPDVLPTLPNPVSPFQKQSADKLIVDLWTGDFASMPSYIKRCQKAGRKDAWILQHVWQHAGYDAHYPDVMPANTGFGGEALLKAAADSAKNAGYLFGLHENYVDMYTDAPSYNATSLAKNPDGTYPLAWFNSTTSKQSYLIKPSLALHYLDIFAP